MDNSYIYTLIAEYGYLAIAIGVAFIGKIVSFAGGIMAHHSSLTLRGVIIASILGTAVADFLYYYIGFEFSHRINVEKLSPKYAKKFEQISKFFNKHPMFFIISYRYIPGLRIAGPIVIGMFKYNTYKFILYDSICIVLTCSFLSILGYYCGALVQRYLQDLEQYEIRIIICVCVAGALYFYFKKRKKIPKKAKLNQIHIFTE